MSNCEARRHDRWRTVWECELTSGHTGFHESDGFLWHDKALVPARAVIASVRYNGTNASEVAKVIEVTLKPKDDDYLPIAVRSGANHAYVWASEWVLLYDDGSIEVCHDDRYRSSFRVGSGSPRTAPVG